MIYTASLSLAVKQCWGNNTYQAKVSDIISKLSLDPEVSDIQALILGPKDFAGISGVTLKRQLPSRHPKLCVIYLYTKAADADLCDVPYKMQVKKINKDAVQEACEQYLQAHDVSAKQVYVAEATPAVEIPPMTEAVPELKLQDEPAESAEPDSVQKPDVMESQVEIPTESVAPVEPTVSQESNDWMHAPTEEMSVVESPAPKNTVTFEEQLENIRSFQDWNLLKEQLKKDAMVARLLDENSEYAGVEQVMDSLDIQIQTIFRDTSLTSEQKFQKITELGNQRKTLRAVGNTLLANKIISIMQMIVDMASRTITKKVEDVTASMSNLVTRRDMIFDEKQINDAIDARIRVQIDLQACIRELIDLYKTISTSVDEEICSLDAQLPSTNEFINNMVDPTHKLFTPDNTASLANSLLSALHDHTVTMSALEDKVKAVIDMLFKLLNTDTEIIQQQSKLLSMLKVNRVENLVVIDSLIKSVISVYAGCSDTGVTATTLLRSYIQSRSKNVLIIDCSGHDKLSTYGYTPIAWDEFCEKRPYQDLCMVTLDIGDLNVTDLANVVKSMLDHYTVVNVIIDSSQHDYISDLAVNSVAINFVTDCSSPSIQSIQHLYADCTYENIARRIIMIDPPVNPLDIMRDLKADPTTTQVATIPYMNALRKCSYCHTTPTELSEVIAIYKEAFR